MPTKPFEIWYSDDTDPDNSVKGLAYAPLLEEKLGGLVSKYWMMSPAEQMAIIYLLETLKPRVAIEIGTRMGGSLQVLAHFSEKVYSLDIDPEVPERLKGKHANVEYIIGSSLETLPLLLDKLQREGAELSFVLVDGDHSKEGVKADIDHVLRFKPTVPLYIIMHDSSNPTCRQGLIASAWSESPYVHAMELDFVMGSVNPSRTCRGEIWGGLSLGILLPEKRQGPFAVTERGELTLKWLSRETLLRRVRKRLGHLVRAARRATFGASANP